MAYQKTIVDPRTGITYENAYLRVEEKTEKMKKNTAVIVVAVYKDATHANSGLAPIFKYEKFAIDMPEKNYKDKDGSTVNIPAKTGYTDFLKFDKVNPEDKNQISQAYAFLMAHDVNFQGGTTV